MQRVLIACLTLGLVAISWLPAQADDAFLKTGTLFVGVSDDFPLASMYAHMRTLRLADGPDEVHRMSVARRELRKYES